MDQGKTVRPGTAAIRETRSTPTIVDGLLYHLSGVGNLVCLKGTHRRVGLVRRYLREI